MTSMEDLAAVAGGTLHQREPGPDIIDVVADSRRVVPGALFCCVVGELHDGHQHAAEAVRDGAIALLCQRRLALDVPQLVVPDVRAVMGKVAAAVHHQPCGSLELIGVTGTNGKTTVVAMIDSILAASGRTTATIGTLTGVRTTPEAPDLQRQLAGFVERGVDSVAMEVSSHALSLHRVDAIEFDVAVFTNLGDDHLDFHGTREAYFAAKAKLFESGRARTAVLNIDDLHGRLLRDAAEIPVVAVSPSSAEDVRTAPDGMHLEWRDTPVFIPLHGRHNVANALLAAEACTLLGVDPATVAAGLASLPAVPGRFEVFRRRGAPTVVVDFAHTPDALEQVLAASRELAGDRGRVTVVFGCGGDRDRSKRPTMGAIASALADRVVLTNDNPRSEDPSSILDEIAAGSDGPVEILPERATAIRSAIDGAGPDDVVVIAGKGHEVGQEFADRTVPFDDRDEVRSALAELDGRDDAARGAQ